MTVSDRFAQTRKKLGYSQVDFAKKLGVSSSAITNYERAVNDLPGAMLVKLSEEFGVSPNWLLLGEGRMFGKSDEDWAEEAAVISSDVVKTVFQIIDQSEASPSPEKLAKFTHYLVKKTLLKKISPAEEVKLFLAAIE